MALLAESVIRNKLIIPKFLDRHVSIEWVKWSLTLWFHNLDIHVSVARSVVDTNLISCYQIEFQPVARQLETFPYFRPRLEVTENYQPLFAESLLAVSMDLIWAGLSSNYMYFLS